MRWILGSLVVINVVVLIWQLLAQDPPPQPIPQSQPSITNADSIKLLSELEEQELQAMMASRERPRLDPETETESQEPLCTLIGPFDKLLRGEYFVERLAALDVKAEVQELEVPGELGYWVYLPSLSSRKEAFDTLRQLQSKGIDSYVIPRGDLENGISFGMFSQEKLAKQRLEDMRSQGYDAELQAVERSYKEVWVVLEPGQSQQLDLESWQAVLADENGIERRQNYCPAVASE